MEYMEFLKTKKTAIKKTGFDVSEDSMNAKLEALAPKLFDVV